MIFRRLVFILIELSLFPAITNAKNVYLINIQGGQAYFDGDTSTTPRNRWATNRAGIERDYKQLNNRFFEGTEFSLGEPVTIDRIDIRTFPGSQICYRLGYQTQGEDGKNQWTFDRYNGVPGFDVRADQNGIQSLPVKPPVRSSHFSIQCFVKPDETSIEAVPTDIDLYHQGEQIKLIPPIKENAKVSASSTLTPPLVYSVDNLFDGKLDTVWAEGAPVYGEGTTVTFTFDTPLLVTALWFFNGHHRDTETFQKNGKLKEFSFAGVTYALKNEPGLQVIPLKRGVQNSEFQLKILSHFPGKKYQDLCISEMGFKSGETYHCLQTEGTRKIAERNRRVLNGENMEKWGAIVSESSFYDGGLSFIYDPETARFSYFSPNQSFRFDGVARVVNTSPEMLVLDLEGYLDRGDFDFYGNIDVMQSRTAEKIKMTLTRPSLLPYEMCEKIIKEQGIVRDLILEPHKKYFGKKAPPGGEEDYGFQEFNSEKWYISPLGFQRGQDTFFYP